MKFLLDTNIVSELMKHPDGEVTRKIREVGPESIFTSVIVVSEVEYGIEKKQSSRLRAQLEGLLPSLPVQSFAQPAEKHYARLRSETEKKGLTLGQNDLLIAAHALSADAVVVTDDRAFLQMPGVTVQNWLQG